MDPPVELDSPATTENEPPAPVSPPPTENSMDPPLPPVAVPVATAKVPLDPKWLAPEATDTCPLTPLAPDSADDSVTSPLDVASPGPLVTNIAPPVATPLPPFNEIDPPFVPVPKVSPE